MIQRVTITGRRYHTRHSIFFSEICLVLGYLQGVTMRYRHFFKKKLIHILYKVDGNAWQRVAKSPKQC